MRFVVVPPHGVSAYVLGRPSIALSPDGSTLALVGLENGIPYLFVRGPGEFDARKVPGSEGAGGPAFSPTGRTVAYLTSTQLKTLPLDGSPAVHGTANDPRGVAWADENTLVYAPESIGGLREVSLRGGAARALTAIDDTKSERTHRWPHVLPGGRWVLFTIGTITSPDNYDESRIDAVDRTTGERRHVFQGASMVRYVPSGHLIFARAGSLFAVRFDPATLKVSGEPVSVLRGIGGDLTTGAAHVTSSDNGTFAYVPGDVSGGMRQLSWSDLKGGRASIHLPAALYNDVRVSPDGARMVVGNGTSGMADIWVYTFARGTYTRLTFTGTNATPVWSRDGRDIYFSSLDPQTAKSTIYKTSADGGRQPQEVASAKIRVYLKEISRDGTSALVDYIAYGGARSNIGRLPLRPDASAEVIVGTRADEYGAALSADGRFLAYNSDEGGSPQIYVLELAAKGGRWQISNAGGEEPAWAVDGKSIFYRIEDRLMSVPVDTRGTFQAGLPAPLFDGIFNLRSDTGISYQPHPDGRRLLMTRAADVVSGGTVRVITRWIDELKGIK
jgi:serine/threonine-protein kinase